jgi:FixJ family two-component response regulator
MAISLLALPAASRRIICISRETHRAKIMLKLGLNSLPQIVQYAVRNDLISF